MSDCRLRWRIVGMYIQESALIEESLVRKGFESSDRYVSVTKVGVHDLRSTLVRENRDGTDVNDYSRWLPKRHIWTEY